MKFDNKRILRVLLLITLVAFSLCKRNAPRNEPSGPSGSSPAPSSSASSGEKPKEEKKMAGSMYKNKGYDWPGLCNTGPKQSPINIIEGGNTVMDSK
jgi:hypothetical protein